MNKTEKRLQGLVDDYKNSGRDYTTVENPRALKIHVKRDLSEHRNVV